MLAFGLESDDELGNKDQELVKRIAGSIMTGCWRKMRNEAAEALKSAIEENELS